MRLFQNFWNLALLKFEHSKSWIKLASLSNIILNLKHQFLRQRTSQGPKSKLANNLWAIFRTAWPVASWCGKNIKGTELGGKWIPFRKVTLNHRMEDTARPNLRAVPQRALCTSHQAWLSWSSLLRSTSPGALKDCWTMANLLVPTCSWATRTALAASWKRKGSKQQEEEQQKNTKSESRGWHTSRIIWRYPNSIMNKDFSQL